MYLKLQLLPATSASCPATVNDTDVSS